MRKIAIVVVMSVIALASFGVELMSSHNDYGSLVHVAAYDSCAADKARADVVCDGTNAAPAINAIVAQMSARDARGGKIVFFPGTYVVDSWMERPAINANGGADVVRFGECKLDGNRFAIKFDANGRKIVRAELLYTLDGADVKWDKRLWRFAEADTLDVETGVVSAALPAGAFAWIVNLVTDDGLVFSTPYRETK